MVRFSEFGCFGLHATYQYPADALDYPLGVRPSGRGQVLID